MLAFFFLVGGLIVLTFVVFKIMDPSSETKASREELAKGFGSGDGPDYSAILLKVGPAMLGFGLIGYLVRQYWDRSDIRLAIASLLLISFVAAGSYFYYLSKTMPKAQKVMQLYSETMMLVSSFLIGTELFAINGYFNDTFKYLLFGSSEIFGIWSLCMLPILYISRSKWLLGITTVIYFFWITPYLNPDLNLVRLFGFELASFTSPQAVLLLPSVGVTLYSLLYAWHQKNNHNLPSSGWRPFYYLTGLFTFFTGGALILTGISQNYSTVRDSFGLVGNLFLILFVVIMFVVDLVLKKSVKGYNINVFSAASLSIAGFVGLFLIKNNQGFLPFLFLEIPFAIWIMADFLRQKSQLSEILFYVFNAIQLFLIVVSPDDLTWLKIITLLAIMLYASWEHLYKKTFVYYTLIAGIAAVGLKLVNSSSRNSIDPFFMVMIVGAVVCVYGLFYSVSRKKILKNKTF